MAPRIIRPDDDRSHWIVAAVCGVASLVVGYAGARKVFRPGNAAMALEGSESANGAGDEGVAEPSVTDAASGPVDAAAPVAAIADAAVQSVAPVVETPPAVPIHITRSVVQSCGDGEELNILGAECATVPGLDEALRHRLEQLGDCPTAVAAAASPDSVLSIGLRVDFPRHRVTALPGHSSSVRSPLTFVPCARAAFEHASEVWRLVPPRPRYLVFYSVHFGPVAVAAGAGGRGTTTTTTTATGTGTTTGTPSGSGVTAEEATVVWARAIVREAPRAGAVVARLPQGTAVTVLAHESQWWQIRWPRGTGWVFGQAIGRH